MMVEQLFARILRALQMDGSAFEEVRDDASFTPVGAGLAAVAILLAGIGAYCWPEVNDEFKPSGYFFDTVILGTILTLALWLGWVMVAYLVLTQVYRETVSPDALFRVCSLGCVPLALGLLVLVPEFGFSLGLVAVALAFALTMFGLRSAFSIDPARLALANTAGFVVFALVLPLLSTYQNAYFTGIFLFSTPS